MPQNGTINLGGVALSAGAQIPKNLYNLPPAAIDAIVVNVSVALKSSGAAFAAVVSTGTDAASEGTDDLDILLNGIISFIGAYIDSRNFMGQLTPAQWRSVLGALNKRDFTGSFQDGSSVPVSTGSATTFKIQMRFPISLRQFFQDGNSFRNGSRRMKDGFWNFFMPSSLTPTLVMANGSAVVQSGMSIGMTAITGPGTQDDIGMSWTVARPASLPTNDALSPGMRLLVADVTPAYTSAVTDWQIAGSDLATPVDFATRYQGEKLQVGGFDVTQRFTPVLWLPDDYTLYDLRHIYDSPDALKYNAVSGVSSLTLYDVRAVPIPDGAVQQVAQAAGAGGEVTIERPAPSSIQPGSAIPADILGMVPVRLRPGSPISSIGRPASSPVQAAAKVQASQRATRQLGAFSRLFGRRS